MLHQLWMCNLLQHLWKKAEQGNGSEIWRRWWYLAFLQRNYVWPLREGWEDVASQRGVEEFEQEVADDWQCFNNDTWWDAVRSVRLGWKVRYRNDYIIKIYGFKGKTLGITHGYNSATSDCHLAERPKQSSSGVNPFKSSVCLSKSPRPRNSFQPLPSDRASESLAWR